MNLKRRFLSKSVFFILGEPPIKRQLLLEFDKTKMPPRSLKASKSTPEGNFSVLSSNLILGVTIKVLQFLINV